MTTTGEATKLCVACGTEFGRKQYSSKIESPNHFAERKTCSDWCRYELIASKKRGRKVSLDLPCSVVGCGQRALAKTLCNLHYHRLKSGKDFSTPPRRSHGHAAHAGPSPEYKAWADMIQRCYASRRWDYKHYGGRGIKVCESWKHSFVDFLAEVGQKPTKEHSLDRIDNNGHYEPGNVRWATRHEQHRNTRGNRYIEFNGTRMTMADWSAKTGINYLTLKSRIDDGGWPLEKALTVPVKVGQKIMRGLLLGTKP